MAGINRRELIGQAATLAGAMALSSPQAEALPIAGTGLPRIKLGKTGIEASLVGMGTGTVGFNNGSNQTRLGQEKFTALVKHAWDSGLTFFDVADSYGSHKYLREAIRGLPREKFVIMTKTFSREPDKARADLERFRKEIGVDYIDIVLMHCVTEGDWNRRFQGVKDVLSEAKQKGIIRAHGCSCHTFEALKAAAADPWVDVDLARFNPWGLSMDHVKGQPEDTTPERVKGVLKQMRASGKGVIGMKILGEGKAVKEGDRAAKINESLRWALGSKAVNMMSIGFESPMQMDEVFGATRVAAAEVGWRAA